MLGLEKLNSKTLPADLSKKFFNQETDYQLINYGNDSLKFEVFISQRKDLVENPVGHICIEVSNRDSFLKKCISNQVEVVQVPKDESLVVFIKDYDGNLFEIKEAIV